MATIKVGIDVSDNGTAQKATQAAERLKKAYDAAGASAKNMGTGAGGSQTGMSAQARAASSAELVAYNQQRAVSQGTGASARDFAKQAEGLGGLVRLYATFAANVFAVTAAFNALSRAMDTTNMIKGLNQLGATSGVALGTLSQRLVQATDGAISLRDAMEATVKASAAGIKSQDILRLGNVAKQASQALGVDMTDAINRLSRGVVKLEPELLDELGIFTKIDPAVKTYAEKLNKTASELTDFERRQAFLNAVLEEGEKKFSAINIDANPYSKLAATFKDLVQNGLELVNKVLAPLVGFLSQSPTLLGAAIGGLAALLIKQAIPAIGQVRAGLADAAERAREVASTKSGDALQARKQLDSLLQSQIENAIEQQIKAVDDGEKKLQAIQKDSINRRGAIARLLSKDLNDITQKDIDRAERRYQRLSNDPTKTAEAQASREVIDGIKGQIKAEADLAAAKKTARENLQKDMSNLSVFGMVQKASRDADEKAIKQSIVSNAAYNGSILGVSASMQLMQAQVKASGLELTRTGAAALYARAAFAVLAGAAATVAATLANVLGIIALVGTAVTLIVGLFDSAADKVAKFDSELNNLKTTGETLANTFENISTKNPFTESSLKAQSSALIEFSSGLEKTAKKASEAQEAISQSVVSRLKEGFLGFFNSGVQKDFENTLSKGIVDSAKRLDLTEGGAAISAKLRAVLNVKDIDNLSEVQAALKGIKPDSSIVKELVKLFEESGNAAGNAASRVESFKAALDSSEKSFKSLQDKFSLKDPLTEFGLSSIKTLQELDSVLKEDVTKSLDALLDLAEKLKTTPIFGIETTQKLLDFSRNLEQNAESLKNNQKQAANLRIEYERLNNAANSSASVIVDVESGQTMSLADPEVERRKSEIQKELAKLRTQEAYLRADIEIFSARVKQNINSGIVENINTLAEQVRLQLSKGATDFLQGVYSRIDAVPELAQRQFDLKIQELKLQERLILIQADLATATTRLELATRLSVEKQKLQDLMSYRDPSPKIAEERKRQGSIIDNLEKALGAITGKDPLKGLSAVQNLVGTLPQGDVNKTLDAVLRRAGAQSQLSGIKNSINTETLNKNLALIDQTVKKELESIDNREKAAKLSLDDLNAKQRVGDVTEIEFLQSARILENNSFALQIERERLQAQAEVNKLLQIAAVLEEAGNRAGDQKLKTDANILRGRASQLAIQEEVLTQEKINNNILEDRVKQLNIEIKLIQEKYKNLINLAEVSSINSKIESINADKTLRAKEDQFENQKTLNKLTYQEIINTGQKLVLDRELLNLENNRRAVQESSAREVLELEQKIEEEKKKNNTAEVTRLTNILNAKKRLTTAELSNIDSLVQEAQSRVERAKIVLKIEAEFNLDKLRDEINQIRSGIKNIQEESALNIAEAFSTGFSEAKLTDEDTTAARRTGLQLDRLDLAQRIKAEEIIREEKAKTAEIDKRISLGGLSKEQLEEEQKLRQQIQDTAVERLIALNSETEAQKLILLLIAQRQKVERKITKDFDLDRLKQETDQINKSTETLQKLTGLDTADAAVKGLSAAKLLTEEQAESASLAINLARLQTEEATKLDQIKRDERSKLAEIDRQIALAGNTFSQDQLKALQDQKVAIANNATEQSNGIKQATIQQGVLLTLVDQRLKKERQISKELKDSLDRLQLEQTKRTTAATVPAAVLESISQTLSFLERFDEIDKIVLIRAREVVDLQKLSATEAEKRAQIENDYATKRLDAEARLAALKGTADESAQKPKIEAELAADEAARNARLSALTIEVGSQEALIKLTANRSRIQAKLSKDIELEAERTQRFLNVGEILAESFDGSLERIGGFFKKLGELQRDFYEKEVKLKDDSERKKLSLDNSFSIASSTIKSNAALSEAEKQKQLKILEQKRAQDRLSLEKEIAEKTEILQQTGYLNTLRTVKSLFKEKTAASKAITVLEKAAAAQTIATNLRITASMLASIPVMLASGVARLVAILGPAGLVAAGGFLALVASLGFGSGGKGRVTTVPTEESRRVQTTGQYYSGDTLLTRPGALQADPTQKLDSIDESLEIIKNSGFEDLKVFNKMSRSLDKIDSNTQALSESLAISLGNTFNKYVERTGVTNLNPLANFFSKSSVKIGTTIGGAVLGYIGGTLIRGTLANAFVSALSAPAVATALGGTMASAIAGAGANIIGILGGPVGLILGAVLGSNIDKIITGIFGGKRTTTIRDFGLVIEGTIDKIAQANEDLIKGFVELDVKISGGLFRRNKYFVENYDVALDKADKENRPIFEYIGTLFTDIKNTLTASAKVLGTDIDEVLETAVITPLKISTKDLKPEEIAERIKNQTSATFNELAEKAFGPLIEALRNPLEEAGTTLTRLATQTQLFSDSMLLLGKNIENITGTLKTVIADDLVKAFGSLENYENKVSFFRENFLTEAERITPVSQKLTEAFQELGISSSLTRDQYKALVLQQDLTTTSGRETFTALLNLGEAFDKVTDFAEQAREKLNGFSVSIRNFIKEQTLQIAGSQQGLTYLLQEFQTTVEKSLQGDEKSLTYLTDIAGRTIESARSTARTTREFNLLRAGVVSSLAQVATQIESGNLELLTPQEQTNVILEQIESNTAKLPEDIAQTLAKQIDTILNPTTAIATTTTVATSSAANDSTFVTGGEGQGGPTQTGPITSGQLALANAVANATNTLSDTIKGNPLLGLVPGAGLVVLTNTAAKDVINQAIVETLNLQEEANNAAIAAANAVAEGLAAAAGLDATGASGGIAGLGWAKGGAFLKGAQMFADGGAFSNSVVSNPTVFPMGVMGEAGPEAIMPLTRMGDGSLGVTAEVPFNNNNRLNQQLIQEVRELKKEMEKVRMGVEVTATGTNKTFRLLDRVTENGDAFNVVVTA